MIYVVVEVEFLKWVADLWFKTSVQGWLIGGKSRWVIVVACETSVDEWGIFARIQLAKWNILLSKRRVGQFEPAIGQTRCARRLRQRFV